MLFDWNNDGAFGFFILRRDAIVKILIQVFVILHYDCALVHLFLDNSERAILESQVHKILHALLTSVAVAAMTMNHLVVISSQVVFLLGDLSKRGCFECPQADAARSIAGYNQVPIRHHKHVLRHNLTGVAADEIDSTNILLLFKIQLALQEGPITIEATFSFQKLIILALHNCLHVPSSLQIQPVKKVQDRLVRKSMVGELC